MNRLLNTSVSYSSQGRLSATSLFLHFQRGMFSFVFNGLKLTINSVEFSYFILENIGRLLFHKTNFNCFARTIEFHLIIKFEHIK